MKAVTFEKPGGVEVLQLVDVEKPTPGQVSINADTRGFRTYGLVVR